MHRRNWRRAIAALVALVVAGLPQIGSAQDTPEPTLRLFAPNSSIKIIKYGTRAARLGQGVFVSAENGQFEIRLTRPEYGQPIQAAQIIRTDAGPVTRPLPEGLITDWFGAHEFFTLEARNASGATVLSKTTSFCPNGEEQQRTSDAGPTSPTYPSWCYGQPFTKGFVWGIDEGWAVGAFPWRGVRLNLPDGTYTVTVAVAEPYREMFGFSPEDATTTFDVTIKTRTRTRRRCCVAHSRAEENEQRFSGGVPTMENPDPAILPDLEALPSWGIGTTSNRKKKDFLSFGATGWTGGASSLVVEGFRRQDEPVMDAWQYFYEDGKPVGRAPAGSLEFDSRRRHNHWHFLQFAAYRLLDADQNRVVRSNKEAFCLAPTDAIDLSLENAVWHTGDLGLHTSCGSPESIWIREILPLGWGDTYFQGGRAHGFNITNLPNGTYYIEVEVNPDRLLHEQSYDNNSELREIRLKGKRGARRVVVPPWNGIDTENGFGRYRRIH